MHPLTLYSPHPRILSAGQTRKGRITDPESGSVTNAPKDGVTAQCGALDVNCKVPSTPDGW